MPKLKPHIFTDGIECKHCAKCDKTLPLSEFTKNKNKADGLKVYCKSCSLMVKKASIAKNLEHYKTQAAEYHERKKKEHNEKHLAYYYANKEKFINQQKEYKKANVEKVREWSRKTKERHKEEYRERRKEYLKSDRWKAIRKKANIKYYASDKGKTQRQICSQKRLAIKKDLISDFNAMEWENCKKYFDGCCAYCGKKLDRLTQDHFIPVYNNGTHTVNNIIPACRPCNSGKQHHDFFEWYPKQPFYSQERQDKILKYLNKIT